MKKQVTFSGLFFALCLMAFSSPDTKEAKLGPNYDLLELYLSGGFFTTDDLFNSESDVQKNLLESKYQAAFGAKMILGGADLRFFNSCAKTEGSEFATLSMQDAFSAQGAENAARLKNIFNKEKCSVYFDLQKFTDWDMSAAIATGCITYSGLYSRQKTPSLSGAASPFFQIPPDALNLKAGLPTKTSSKKPDSFFFSYTFPKQKNADSQGFIPDTLRLSGFVNPPPIEYSGAKPKAGDTEASLNIEEKFFWKNAVKFSADTLISKFTLSPKISDSWYSSQKNFYKKSFLYFTQDVTLSIPYFKTKLIFSAIENPADRERFWMRTENLISAGSFLLSVNGFASDNLLYRVKEPLLSPGGSVERKIYQIKASPGIKIFLRDGKYILFSGGGYIGSSIENPGIKQDIETALSFAAGIKYFSKSCTGRLDFTSTGIKPPELNCAIPASLPAYAWTAAFSHPLKKKAGRLSVTTSVKYYPSFDSSKSLLEQSASLSFYPGTPQTGSGSDTHSGSGANSQSGSISQSGLPRSRFGLKSVTLSAGSSLKGGTAKWNAALKTAFGLTCGTTKLTASASIEVRSTSKTLE